jgi:hypothetical protein
LDRRLGEPQSRSVCRGEEKNTLLLPGDNIKMDLKETGFEGETSLK